ncbi:hypothetical protein K3495_g16114 [Podosphaera aphanis]|nr:hypothetical protein K3495_g16114 [Podosphaera aphanis]
MELLQRQQGLHINILEVEAITAAFKIWAPLWAGKTVHVYTDSTVAFNAVVNHRASGKAFYPLREIILEAAAFDIHITASHIPGTTNTVADALSRFNWKFIANLFQNPYQLTPYPVASGSLFPPQLPQ